MACCRTDPKDAGYATPLAMAMCVAIALSISALMAAAASDLQLARRDLDREKAEYELAGEQVVAAMTIAQSRGGSRLQWAMSGDKGMSEVVADAEFQKLSYAPAAEIDANVLRTMEVRNPEAIRSSLRAKSEAPSPDRTLHALDSTTLWGLCAPALISRYGAAGELAPIGFVSPGAGVSAAASRAGELWRVRVAGGGWVDERVVRFTGDLKRPAAVVERRFFRGEKVGSKCDAVFSAAAKAD